MLYCFGRQEGGQTKQTLQLSIIIIYHERETYYTKQRAATVSFYTNCVFNTLMWLRNNGETDVTIIEYENMFFF